jgi:hypothetical protein
MPTHEQQKEMIDKVRIGRGDRFCNLKIFER